MSTADHATCCCAETLDALRSARWKAAGDRVVLTHRLTEAIAERDRARDLAARLEAELARGFRTAAPDITLTRTNNGAPETPEAVPREGQDGAENGPSRVTDGLEGLDWHSGTPATEEARKSAESDALPAGPFPPPHRYPTPIIEWLASVGLDAKGIPADGVRIIGRTPLGGCLLLVQSFEVTPDGRRIILADGSGFARTRHRRIEVTTLPPEPWLSTWGGWRGSPPTPCPCLDAPTPQDRPQESP